MCGLRVGERAVVEALDVIRAHDRDVPAGERQVDQCLVLRARRVFRGAAARPERLADDPHVPAGMGVGELAQHARDDPARVASGLGHVDHLQPSRVHFGGQQREPLARYRDGDRVTLPAAVFDERHETG